MHEHIDKSLVRNRFARSFRAHGYAAIIQPGMAKYLLELLSSSTTIRSFKKVLELGCGVSTMAPEFLKAMSADTWVANDIVQVENEFRESVKDLELEESRFLCGDMEDIDLPGDQNLIISNAAIQWTKEPEVFLASIVKKLAPGGIFAFSTFGPENLCEMRELTGLSLDYLPSSAYPPIFSAYGRILCQENLKSVIKFDSPLDVLKHLRATGTNSLARQSWTKGSVKKFSDLYRAKFAIEEQIGLTYHPMYVIFQKY
jgi:malonyl-CoA O-methyltransferase